MTSTDETTAPTAPPSTRAPREDRAGLVWGTVLGAVILVVALVVALGGGTVPAAGDARAVVSAGGTQTVAVTLAGMRITPSVIEVPSGTRLVLDVTNTDAMRHDLVLATGADAAAGRGRVRAPGRRASDCVGRGLVQRPRAPGCRDDAEHRRDRRRGDHRSDGARHGGHATGTSATVAPAIDFQAAPADVPHISHGISR